jgi:hypothetical protein
LRRDPLAGSQAPRAALSGLPGLQLIEFTPEFVRCWR